MVIFVINAIMVVTNTQPHDIESYLRPGYRILHTIYFQLQAATQDQSQSYYQKTHVVPIDYSNMLQWRTGYKGLLAIQSKCILNLGKGQLPTETLIIRLKFDNVASVRHVIVGT